MADDIDIEEHDLLGHPQVAGICLQCLSVKSQPVEYEDNYDEYSGAIYDDSYPIKNEPMDCDTEQTHIGHPISITSVTSETIPQNETANVQMENLQSTRIILAKKPCSRYKPEPQTKTLFIMLEDWGEKLNTSPCFCRECQTLFATRIAIDAHNMTTHSFLVPVEKPLTQESPPQKDDSAPQNQPNMVQLMLEDCGEKLNRTPRYCKECQTLFATRNDIDAHNMAAHSFLVPVENIQTPESPPQTEDRPPQNQPNMFQLILKDFGEILNTSPCFCKECQTLFATRKAIDAHNMAEHSFDVMISSNMNLRSECIISKNLPQQNKYNTPARSKCIYYRCEKCYCSTSKLCNTVRHVCPVEKDTRVCHNCNNVFHYSEIISHNQKHDKTGMIRDDIVIKPFNANIKPGEWRVDLYECKNCKTKFPTYLLNTHQCRSKATKRIQLTLYRCNTCKELFCSKENREKHSKTCYIGRRKCIFKCKKCSRFMLSRASVQYHTSENSEDKTVIKPCKYCGWKFTPLSLHKHIKLHHQSLKLTPNNFCIKVIDTHCGALANVNKKNQKQFTNVSKDNIKPVVIKKTKKASVESSTCDMKPAITTYKSRKERLMDRTLKKEINTENDEAYVKINVNMDIEKEQKVEQKNSSESNEKARHNTILCDKMKNADSEQSLIKNSSVDQTNKKKRSPQPDETLSQPKKSPTTPYYAATKKYTHKIYKCGKCNVYFMAQYTCYIHMLHHTPIEENEFIECKLCNLPFKIVSLNTHMKKHHKENFNLDQVLVAEYTNEGCNTPKFQIYYATEKIQSRLISTTSDELNSERYIESNSQPSSSSSNAQTSDDVVGTSQVDTSGATMDAQPTISLETVDDNTDTNDDVVEISQSDTSSDVTNNIQPSVSSESKDDSTDESEDIILIDIQEKTNADVKETSQSDTSSDVTMNNNLEPSVISVSSESDDDSTDEIEDINSIEKGENAIQSYRCQFCRTFFKSNTSREFHESLDHLDGEKNCMICDQTFNASILNALHLNIKNNTFECCMCNERFDVQEMANHAVEH